jgi:hypothetical protein
MRDIPQFREVLSRSEKRKLICFFIKTDIVTNFRAEGYISAQVMIRRGATVRQKRKPSAEKSIKSFSEQSVFAFSEKKFFFFYWGSFLLFQMIENLAVTIF